MYAVHAISLSNIRLYAITVLSIGFQVLEHEGNLLQIDLNPRDSKPPSIASHLVHLEHATFKYAEKSKNASVVPALCSAMLFAWGYLVKMAAMYNC